MRQLGFLFFLFFLSLSPRLYAEKIDRRNFAIDTCYPTSNEIHLAEGRARNYWAKHAVRFGSNPVYLAVQDFENFSGRGPRSLAKTDKLRDNGQFLFSRN